MRRCLFFVVAALALTVCSEVHADAVGDCHQEQDVERTIRGCTLIIEGRAKGDKANAHHNRGVIYGRQGQYDRAIADFDQASRLAPENANSYAGRGDSYSGKGEFDRAIADYDRAIRLDPLHSYAFNGRAYAFASKGEYDRAIAAFDQSIRINPTARAYWGRGASYAAIGEYDRALADHDQSIRLAQDNPEAYYRRGITYIEKGEHDRAIADFDRAIQLAPRGTYNYIGRGSAYAEKGEFGRAMADFDQAIRLSPEGAEGYIMRGGTYVSKGDHEYAVRDFDHAIRLAPGSARAYLGRAYAFRGKGEFDRAITDLDKAIHLGPRNEIAYIQRAITFAFKNEYDRAFADHDQAFRLAPNSRYGYFGRCITYADKGEDDRALADCDQAVRLAPNISSMYQARGSVLTYKGEHERAIADFHQAVRLSPGDASAYNGRAYAHYRNGKTQEARIDADKAVSLLSTYETRTTRGRILIALNETNAALDDLNEALRLRPDGITAIWGRGQAYEQQGLRSLALADYKRAIELKPRGGTRRDDLEALAKARARLAAMEAKAATPQQQPIATPRPDTAKAPVGRRLALVIGNGAYEAVPKLANPANDAAAIAAELTRLGFEVIEKRDLGVQGMRRALADFETKAAGADWALVYYAGHGMELGGRNWLIPVDAKLATSNDVPDETVPLDRVLDRVRVAKKLRIVFLDACRNNPFLSRMIATAGKTRALDRGLARIEPEHGEVVFYAARDGSVAADGVGEHSPFAAALLKHLGEDGVELGRLFRKVTSTVLSSTNPQQEPFVYGRIPDEDFYFKPAK